MIRTALLAGILLVMLSIAYNRPGVLPEMARTAATKVEEQTRKVVDRDVEPVVRPVPVTRKAEAPAPIVEEEVAPPVVEAEAEPVIAAPVAAVPAPIPAPVPVAVAVPPPAPIAAPPAGAPMRLYPVAPAMMPGAPPAPTLVVAAAPVAAPAPVVVPPPPAAELPVATVVARPALPPRDAPRGTVHVETPPSSVLVDDGSTPHVDMPGQQAAPAPQYMTPRERSRELYRLAREMEGKFLDKLAR